MMAAKNKNGSLDEIEVKEVARRVLEQFLQRHTRPQRSQSLNDASKKPHVYQAIAELEEIDEKSPPNSKPASRRQSFIAASQESILSDLEAQGPSPPKSKNGRMAALNRAATISATDFDMNIREKIRNSQGSSVEEMLNELERIDEITENGKKNGGQIGRGLEDRNYLNIDHETESMSRSRTASPATDIEELTDTDSEAPRKKKSFFKKAQERIRESLRRNDQKTKPKSSKTKNNESDLSNAELNEQRKQKNKEKKKKKLKLLRHKSSNSSDGQHKPPIRKLSSKSGSLEKQHSLASTLGSLRSTLDSDDILLEERHYHTRTHIHQDVDMSQPGRKLIMRTEETEVDIEDMKNGKKKKKHKKLKVKESDDVELGILDTFRNTLRRGSSSLKRKFSIKDSKNQKSYFLRSKSHEHSSPDHSRKDGIAHTIGDFRREGVTKEASPEGVVTKVFEEVISRADTLDEIDGRCLEGLEGMGIDSSQGSVSLSPTSVADRSKLKLFGLIPSRPDIPTSTPNYDLDFESCEKEMVVKHKDGSVDVKKSTNKNQHLTLPSCVETDSSLSPISSPRKPFHEKTHSEKDDLYEKIAKKLANIADNYVAKVESESGVSDIETPCSQDASSSLGASGDTEPSSLEMQLAHVLRGHGDRITDNFNIPAAVFSGAVSKIAKNATYNIFTQTMSESLRPASGVTQIAMLFQLTQSAMQAVGNTGALASKIKEYSLQYFADKFAGYVMTKGGWDSMLEESDSELD